MTKDPDEIAETMTPETIARLDDYTKRLNAVMDDAEKRTGTWFQREQRLGRIARELLSDLCAALVASPVEPHTSHVIRTRCDGCGLETSATVAMQLPCITTPVEPQKETPNQRTARSPVTDEPK
jgi:hypothetical protein